MKNLFLPFLSILFFSVYVNAQYTPEFSTAGFYELDNGGRNVNSMNVGWKLYKGKLEEEPVTLNYDDASWSSVNLPNGIEYLPEEASGGINYQGEVWYRKHFIPKDSLADKKMFLHFEAIMGKSKIWLNGTLLKTTYGGYLPIVIDITGHINLKKDNVITVWADNSDDPSYPPGKEQDLLDFTYFGGIYRDCWLITHNKTYITNANHEDIPAGGGLLVAYKNVSENSADIILNLHTNNEINKKFHGYIEYDFVSSEGKRVTKEKIPLFINSESDTTTKHTITIKKPSLWSPETPYLYNLYIKIKDENGNIIDGYRKKIGIRSIEFKGKDGFWLNGKPYIKPLIGANRHQDFAILGNALPNSIHWRDAKKLKDVGMSIIRNAHYPQDPAFMDACDELGLFVIVNTPGWQFWNKDPNFENLVYQNIRNMMRRDRNHASIFLWEPILNETWYPDYFAKHTVEIVEEEFPYENSYAVSDDIAKGSEHFQIQYAHPYAEDIGWGKEKKDPSKTYFTREWGDNVDTWNAHNSTSRVSRGWGEHAMLVQAKHYANPSYPFTNYEVLYSTDRQHIGGALWHSFDHQRGYHPDTFYGGLMDAFRQPKYSYYMFMAQRDPKKSNLISDSGPMLYIANEMTPFSSEDVVIYSNCDEVKLTAFKDGETKSYHRKNREKGMPFPPIIFKNLYNFMQIKAKTRANKASEVYLKAEGYINGVKVASDIVYPSYRAEKIVLKLDNEGNDFIANGSDIVTVISSITDKNGTVKHLNNSIIKFEIEGEATIVGDNYKISNPKKVAWGTAPILIKSTTTPGSITIKASILNEGSQRPIEASIKLESVPAKNKLLFNKELILNKANEEYIKSPSKKDKTKEELLKEIDKLKKEINNYKLKDVEQRQNEFGEKN